MLVPLLCRMRAGRTHGPPASTLQSKERRAARKAQAPTALPLPRHTRQTQQRQVLRSSQTDLIIFLSRTAVSMRWPENLSAPTVTSFSVAPMSDCVQDAYYRILRLLKTQAPNHLIPFALHPLKLLEMYLNF